ncbi:MAG: carboxypeptidase-like regulatory domain-containing protein [Muribaculaceae bacterium]|nr:carboxypeptidase-like regulatory domain-containing protein [Muribaculaceae bacterium]
MLVSLFGLTSRAAETVVKWTFDKKVITSDNTYIKRDNYTEYLPDGWAFNGGNFDYRISFDEGTQVLKGANSTYVTTTKLIIFPVKAGTLSFEVKTISSGSMVLALYKMTPKDGGGYTAAAETFYKETLSSPAVSATEYKWVDVDIDDDCYVGMYLGNQALCREIKNTYAGATVGSYTVSGIVKDEDGNAVEGATVKIGSESVDTAADGSWTLENMADGKLTVRVSKEGFRTASTDVTVDGADLGGVELTLEWIVSTIKGHLMDESDYATVYGKLTFSDSEGTVYATTETTPEMPDYEVKFKGVVPTSFNVDIEPKYYKPVQYKWSPSVGQEYTRNFVVSRLILSVNVKPVDTDGNPVTGATVALVEKDNADATVALGESGAGTYTANRFYAHVAADKKYVVTVEHPDYEPYTSEEVVFDGEGKTIEPVLKSLAPTVFKGVVKSGLDQEPLADATVSISLPDTPTALATVTTGPDGTYSLSLDGALEAAYVLSIYADYFEPEVIDITEPERSKEYVNDAVLKAVMLSFTARVENEAGEAVEGAVLNFNGADLEAAEGVYTAEVPSYGSYWNEYTVKVSAPGYEAQEETVIFNGMPVEKVYTLKEIMLTYTATVVNEAGETVEGATVTFDGTELTAADGAYSTQVSYNAAADKTFAVEVSAEGYKTQTVDVAFDGKDVTAVYTLEEVMLTYTATVVNEAGEAIEGATVTFDGTELTAADGAYSTQVSYNAAADKTFAVEVSAKGYKTQTVEVAFDGKDVTAVYTLEEAMLTFVAIVADESVEPIEGATVVMTDGENTWTLEEYAPAMYSVSLPALEADGNTYTVTVSKEGYETSDPYTFTFEGEDHFKAFYLEEKVGGIDSIDASADGTVRVYDINGRRITVDSVKELPAGFYIINGVKTVIR